MTTDQPDAAPSGSLTAPTGTPAAGPAPDGSTMAAEAAGLTKVYGAGNTKVVALDAVDIGFEAERRLAMLGVDDLLRPVVRALVRSAQPAGENGGSGFRISGTLRSLAEHAGLSMLEAHRALHQLFDRKLLHLAEDRLEVLDL